LISFIKRQLYPVFSKFFSHATLVEGRLKGTEHPFRCFFVDNSSFADNLMARMYEAPPVVLQRRRIWIPALKKLISGKTGNIDLCVAVLPTAYESTFQGLYDYKCTEAVRQVIDTSGSWEDIKSGFSATKRKKTNRFSERYGLGSRVSEDLKEFDFFYHRMFVPHIKKRFGELSVIDSYDEMKEFFLKGRLLFITKDNEAVAGALSLVEDGTLVFRRTGVLDGDETHIEGGAQLALYYFQIKYANEHKLRAVDSMMSAPFFNDGVYRNKREWGATVLPDNESRTWVYFFHAAPSEKIAHFFEINPTIVHSDKGLKGVVGISGTMEIPIAAINDITHRYQARGLEGFTVVTNTGVVSAS
jgi:hypothetical protein